MSNIVAKLPDLYESYKLWVSSNPSTVGDVETTVKWLSYFLVGRVNSSTIVSELIYTLSNLLVLFNDRIIEKSKSVCISSDRSKYRLKILLTTLEYSEVFIELSAKKLWGERGRWIFITIVQIAKCIGRFVLKFYHHELITQNPPIVALDRKNIDKIIAETSSDESMPEMFDAANSTFTFKLKRSGRVVRKVEGSPPVYLRSWKPLDPDKIDVPTSVPSVPIVKYKSLNSAETLYILKPIIHLTSAGIFGINSWKSYSVALFIDLASLNMYKKNIRSLSPKQRLELSRRTIQLLLYVIRSPFYEKFTQHKLNALINAIACTIPFSSTVCQPLLEYIPQWQKTYFYMWST
ncbi:peroxisomal membrane protein PEX16 [Contarinia nasturtii]|uniref:peroxisomal membrane protein PEX16 n=1 Tax=Contarinia nasturtii TaxID=265458 RepID=UPI0012D3FE91|nr:peroxisomal membrane protein PEX16 [Contarinia nasturtii]